MSPVFSQRQTPCCPHSPLIVLITTSTPTCVAQATPQALTFMASAKPPLPYKMTYPQILGLGCRHHYDSHCKGASEKEEGPGRVELTCADRQMDRQASRGPEAESRRDWRAEGLSGWTGAVRNSTERDKNRAQEGTRPRESHPGQSERGRQSVAPPSLLVLHCPQLCPQHNPMLISS